MFKKIFIAVLSLSAFCVQVWADAAVSFGATIYAEQKMSDNGSCNYMVNWAVDAQGNWADASEAEISSHVTTLSIDASGISGTVKSISVYALDKTPIAGPMVYQNNAITLTSGAGSIYSANGQSDVVMVTGNAKNCKAYLRPVLLKSGVMVTVRTEDGKFYSQKFTETIQPNATKTLTLTGATDSRLWMSTIPGDIYFSFVSTPGAHDATTSSVDGAFSDYAQCQGEDLATLLKNGVRAFDIRPNYKNSSTITADNLYIYHGSYNTNVKYVDAMKILVDFVKENPSEALSVIMVKEAGDGKTDYSTEMYNVLNACHSSYSAYMKVLDHSYYTLDDFRGKICYINRNGADVTNTTRIYNWPDNDNASNIAIGSTCSANVQDKYNSNGTDKQNAVKEMLQTSSSNQERKVFHYNYCSSAYQKWNIYSPGHYAKETNPVITTYLNGGNISGPTGYLYADYIGSSSNGGAALLTAIIEQNYRYVFKGASYVAPTEDANHSQLSADKGWKRVTSTDMLSAEGLFHYALVDKATGLMLSLEEGSEQSKADTKYKTMVYRTAMQAERNPWMLWNISTNTSGGFSIKCAEPGVNKYLQTEYNNAWFCRTHDNGGGDASWYAWLFCYDPTNKWWTIQNGKYPSSGYIGLWETQAIVDGMEVAGNKSGDYIGHFEIYAIPRNRANWQELASMESPVDYTPKINNNSFERGNTDGWTNTQDGLIFATDAPAFTNKVGNKCVENWWTESAAFSFEQALTGLPNGIYELSALCINVSNDHDLYLFAGENQTKVNVHDNPADLYKVRTCVSNGSLTIGIKGSKPAYSWVAADNFELQYLGNSVTLADNAPFSNDTDLGPIRINYSRQISRQWGTIILPFEVDIDENEPYDFYLFNGVSNGAISLVRATGTLPANTPALLRVNAEQVADGKTYDFCLSMPDKTLCAVQNSLSGETHNGFTLTGTYQTIDMKEREGYVMSGNNFYSISYLKEKYPTKSINLTPFRVWLSGTEQSASSSLRISLDTETEETAIERLDADSHATVLFYDLNGRRVSPNYRGFKIKSHSTRK